jgi:anti-sigma factor RsiW
MNWSCTQVEERMSDYIEGSLAEAEQREFREHADACPQCGPLLAQVTHVIGRLHTLEPAEIPVGLIPNILDQTIGPRKETRNWIAWMPALLQPRFAIGFATVLATLLIIFQAVGVQKPNTALAILSPVNIYHVADRHAHLVFARGVKFVNDLRVVYEIQSRLQPAGSAPPAEQQSAPSPPQAEPPKSQRQSRQDHSENRRYVLFAAFLMTAPGGSPR